MPTQFIDNRTQKSAAGESTVSPDASSFPWGCAMPNSIQAPCPLCNLTSTAHLEDYAKWTHFFCPCCRDFKVSKLVMSTLRAEPVDVRERLSQQARALTGGNYLHIAAAEGKSLQPKGLTPWCAEVRQRQV